MGKEEWILGWHLAVSPNSTPPQEMDFCLSVTHEDKQPRVGLWLLIPGHTTPEPQATPALSAPLLGGARKIGRSADRKPFEAGDRAC